jgi:hypothetical protein
MTPRAVAILALCSQLSLFAQATANSVPFVGCVSFGQTQKPAAPQGTSRLVAIDAKDAGSLAYYASADGIGLLAPRHWYCEGVSGSGGEALYISPEPIDRGAPEWKGFRESAIVANHITSAASGRYEIAEITAHVFPAYRAAAQRIWETIDGPLPRGPYPNDSLKYRSETVVEFTTPARKDGLGTHYSWLKPNDSPVTGVAILIGDPPDLLHLSVRLPPESTRLAPVIVQHFENTALGR